MAHKNKVATIFGGTGFLGKQIVRELAAQGVCVKVATRVPESAYSLKTCGVPSQIVPFLCDYSDESSVRRAVKNSDIVVNCIGRLFEKGKNGSFQKVHVDIPAMIANACTSEGVGKFVHISSLGCDKGASKYAQSKLAGEEAVLSNFPKATILRPSVMFGEDDKFFNKFAELSRFTPFLPLIGGGNTKFQPIYVSDVCAVVMTAIFADGRYQGKIYQLGGADIVTFRDVYNKVAKYTGRSPKLISVPFRLAKIQAFFFSMLPNPILTCDQVEGLKSDNIVDKGKSGLQIFNITPKPMDLILPDYLERYKSGGRFAAKQAA